MLSGSDIESLYSPSHSQQEKALPTAQKVTHVGKVKSVTEMKKCYYEVLQSI